jgi:adenosine deaminase
MSEARKLGARLGWEDDFAKQRDRLFAAGMDGIVAAATHAMNLAEQRMRAKLHCAEPALARPGCRVTVRYLAQIIRVFPREQVFAEDVLAFRLIETDKRFVGLNMVAPEDDPTSLRDYTLHMKMLGFLHGLDPTVQMSLHAGELVPGLVTPEDLRFHIRQAVEIAGAERIGHGVDVTHEDDAPALLAEMAQKRVMVEINLTSNDQILNVRGAAHPFPLYRDKGVPTALSTDDEGVSRIDLTHEYVRATEDFHLGYRDLKGLSRNALEYAFLAGPSLWADARNFVPVAACADDKPGATTPQKDCAAFLASSEKAREQWRLEADFTAFETEQR